MFDLLIRIIAWIGMVVYFMSLFAIFVWMIVYGFRRDSDPWC